MRQRRYTAFPGPDMRRLGGRCDDGIYLPVDPMMQASGSLGGRLAVKRPGVKRPLSMPQRCCPPGALGPDDADSEEVDYSQMWILAKRLRKLSVCDSGAGTHPVPVAVGHVGPQLPGLAFGPDLRSAPRVRLCDADGDVADEFWEEARGPTGVVAEEGHTSASLSLAIVPADHQGGNIACCDGGAPDCSNAVEQVRQELASRSTRELKRLLDRSGAGSFGLVEKAELVERVLSCVSTIAAGLDIETDASSQLMGLAPRPLCP